MKSIPITEETAGQVAAEARSTRLSSRASSPASLAERTLQRLRAAMTFLRKAIRQRLLDAFPIAYECIFTRGNFDESAWAAIRGHRQVVRLMARPALRPLPSTHRPIVYRPFRMYLAASFTKKVRREIMTHHYSYLVDRVTQTFFSDLLTTRPVLWRQTVGDHVVSVRLSFTEVLHHEGDLLLEFSENGVPLYDLSFTIAPGSRVGSEVQRVILIARLQGVPGRFEAIRRATKACRDVAPPHLLLAVAQGISSALNVDVIAGVRNSEQITANLGDNSCLYFDYDVFWRTYQATERDMFYLIPVPFPEKPLEQISVSHRRRTRAKRLFKSSIAATSKANFARSLVNPR